LTAKPIENAPSAGPIADRRVLSLLERMATRDAFPHALLFVGPDGVGKSETATRIAMALNCGNADGKIGALDGEPCRCRSCRKIRAGVHPDMHRIVPEGPRIRIDRIRELIERLARRPNEARVRFAIVERAGTMNPEAGNALLKLLEEPPDRTVLILTAVAPSDLLPTLVSRCRTLRFSPRPRAKRAETLAERLGISRDRALALAALDEDAISEPADADARLRRRDWVVDAAADLLAPTPSAISTVALALAFAERLATDRDEIPARLAALEIWLRDRIVRPHASDRLLFPDRDDPLARPEGPVSAGRLLDALRAVDEARRRLQSNVNPRLALEVMTLRIAETRHEKDRRHPVQAGRQNI
jgi:DNA polymerase III subunit delta'